MDKGYNIPKNIAPWPISFEMPEPRPLNKSNDQVKARYDEGLENRIDLHQLSGNDSRKELARSIGCLVRTYFEDQPYNWGQFPLSTPKLHQWIRQQKKWDNVVYPVGIPYGENEPYGDQLVPGYGTAFLVGEKIMLTAAHCVCKEDQDILYEDSRLNAIRIIFDFVIDKDNNYERDIPSNRIYKIKRVLAYQYVEGKVDWALLELNKKVQNRQPLSLDFSQNVQENLNVYMLGHPLGLPIKLTQNGKTIKCSDDPLDQTFSVKIDAYTGNSGSPLFRAEDQKVVGILIRGNSDHEVKNIAGIGDRVVRKINTSNSYELCQSILGLKDIQLFIENSIAGRPTNQALFELAFHLYEGKKMKKNVDLAISYFDKISLQTPAAAYNLGIHFYHKRDLKRAVYYFQLAGEYPEAVAALASCYLKGEGIKKDEAKGRELLDLSIKTSPSLSRNLQNKSPKFIFPSHIRNPLDNFAGNRIKEFIKLYSQKNFGARYNDSCLHFHLHGKEAIGKTELAINFAFTKKSDFSFICMIRCDTVINKKIDYKRLANFLKIETTDDLEQLVETVHSELEKHPETPWLLIFDHIDAEITLPGNGGVVITTAQNEDLWKGDNLTKFKVDPLSNEETRLYFLQKLSPNRLEGLDELNSRLEGRPLLLSHAFKLIEDNPNSNVQSYLDSISQLKLHNKKPSIRYSQRSLQEAFEITFKTLQGRYADTLEILYHCVFLNPEKIPLDFLEQTTNTPNLAWKETFILPLNKLDLLKNYTNKKKDFFCISHFFQQFLRTKLTPEKCQEYFGKVIDIVNNYSKKFDENQEDTWQHAEYCVYHIEKLLQDDLWDTVNIFTKNDILILAAKWHLLQGGSLELALRYSEKSYDLGMKMEDSQFVAKAASFTIRGRVLSNAGELKESLDLHQKALRLYKLPNQVNIENQENQLVLADTYNHLGNVSDMLSLYKNAIEYHTQALEIREQSDKPLLIAKTLNNMGISYQSMSMHKTALGCLEEAIKIRENKLGSLNIYTGHSYHNKGLSLLSLGHYKEALKFLEISSNVIQKSLDTGHLDNILCQNNIGIVYSRIARYKEALEIQKDVLSQIEQKKQKIQPLINQFRLNKAEALTDLGFYEDAVQEIEMALTNIDSKKNKSDKFIYSYALFLKGWTLGLQKSIEYSQILKIKESALGIIEELTYKKSYKATYLSSISLTYLAIGNLEKAKEFQNSAKIIREEEEEVLGKDHPETACSYHILGLICMMENKFEPASKFFLDAFKIRFKFLNNHPNTALTCYQLALCYKELNELDKFNEYKSLASEIWGESYGSSYPITNARMTIDQI